MRLMRWLLFTRCGRFLHIGLGFCIGYAVMMTFIMSAELRKARDNNHEWATKQVEVLRCDAATLQDFAKECERQPPERKELYKKMYEFARRDYENRVWVYKDRIHIGRFDDPEKIWKGYTLLPTPESFPKLEPLP